MTKTRRSVGTILVVVLALVWSLPLATGQDDSIRPAARAAGDRAVDFLLKTQNRNGMWYHMDAVNVDYNLGCTALVATALLASDPTKCARAVQSAEAAILGNLDQLKSTYSLAFSIIFLERRGKSASALIPKLLSGQHRADGGWGYRCPPSSNETDNSNTHLAVLSMLVYRMKHSDPKVNEALKLAETRFRRTQSPDGAWVYEQHVASNTTVSMCCVGLLGLAVGIDSRKRDVMVSLKGSAAGAQAEKKLEELHNDMLKFLQDPQVKAAQRYLLANMAQLKKETEHVTYVLWSVERIAFLYGPREFYGQLDWYEAGCRLLLSLQLKDGSWNHDLTHGPSVDTAFALLFINRVNLLADLTVSLQGGKSLTQRGPSSTAASSKRPQGPKGTPEEANALAKEMESAIGPRVDEILKKLEIHTNNAYRDALLEIIASERVRASYKDRARDSLANRMSNLDANKLRAYMQETPGDPELKRAAAIGALRAEYKELIPDLIDLLSDQNSQVASAAHAALKGLTNQDHGRTPEGWKRWYEANKTKK